MKNLSLALNIILLVAVIVLYVLYFTGNKSSSPMRSSSDSSAVNMSIAYINADTVLKYYDFFKANQEILIANEQKLNQEFRARATGLQNEFNAYQRNVNSMTLGQVRATEEDLAKKQQNLQLYEQSLGQQLMAQRAKVNKELYDRITDYLKEFGSENGLQVVFKYDVSSDVLYGTPGIDISRQVIAGLNERYKAEKEKGSTKADTTKTK